jgi:integrase
MKKKIELLPLFRNFIRDTESGKRLKKNGGRIRPNTIENYRYALNNLIKFSTQANFDLRICDASKLSKKDFTSEKNYWRKFYQKFTDYLYKNGCHDNYVGANIKIIRTFFGYLKNDKDINTGDFQSFFFVRKEEIQIFVLSPMQLKFLIHDKEFENSLSPSQRRIKDIFVFGCTTSLRFADIFLLTNKNFEFQGSECHLKTKSKKTKTYSQIKLPSYAIEIYNKYRPSDSKSQVFSSVSLFHFNKCLKKIGEKAKFTDAVEVAREKQGKVYRVKKKTDTEKNRFCDQMSSHMMRRTAITTLLILGMPEHLVRKISGHSNASSSFGRYVHYAQSYMDKEIEKVHEKLEAY